MARDADGQRTALRSESVSGPNSAAREYAITALSALRDPRDLERGRKATADPYVRKTIEATIRELRGG